MNETLRAQWDKFFLGCWTKERPTKPGKYPTRTYDGHPGQTVLVYALPNGGVAQMPSWGGFYWTEPRPDMPELSPGV